MSVPKQTFPKRQSIDHCAFKLNFENWKPDAPCVLGAENPKIALLEKVLWSALMGRIVGRKCRLHGKVKVKNVCCARLGPDWMGRRSW